MYWAIFDIKCVYSCVLKCMPFLCLVSLYFPLNSIFQFYISKDLTNIKGVLMYPLK